LLLATNAGAQTKILTPAQSTSPAAPVYRAEAAEAYSLLTHSGRHIPKNLPEKLERKTAAIARRPVPNLKLTQAEVDSLLGDPIAGPMILAVAGEMELAAGGGVDNVPGTIVSEAAPPGSGPQLTIIDGNDPATIGFDDQGRQVVVEPAPLASIGPAPAPQSSAESYEGPGLLRMWTEHDFPSNAACIRPRGTACPGSKPVNRFHSADGRLLDLTPTPPLPSLPLELTRVYASAQPHLGQYSPKTICDQTGWVYTTTTNGPGSCPSGYIVDSCNGVFPNVCSCKRLTCIASHQDYSADGFECMLNGDAANGETVGTFLEGAVYWDLPAPFSWVFHDLWIPRSPTSAELAGLGGVSVATGTYTSTCPMTSGLYISSDKHDLQVGEIGFFQKWDDFQYECFRLFHWLGGIDTSQNSGEPWDKKLDDLIGDAWMKALLDRFNKVVVLNSQHLMSVKIMAHVNINNGTDNWHARAFFWADPVIIQGPDGHEVRQFSFSGLE